MYHSCRFPSAGACAMVLAIGLVGCGDPGPSNPVDASPAATPSAPAGSDARATVRIGNAMAGWLPVGLDVDAGDSLVLFASGNWDVEGLTLEPRHMLWYRIGEEGTATNFRANQEFIEADTHGELFLTLRPLGLYWDDARGTYPPGFDQAPAIPVDVEVEAVRVRTPLEEGLQDLLGSGDTRARQALATLSARNVLPAGFSYLQNLGRSNVWADGTADGRPGIRAETSDDVGIVRMPLDIPLSRSTELRFDWRYDSLPALGPETEPQNHDYLSIALEFDNGQDLTWMWSPFLESGTHFGCPLPWWDERETHYVIQSGEAGLGDWFSHRRNVLADYRQSIDVPEPGRIVGVWFIANSLFGRQRAAASFAEVRISNGDAEVVVFGR